MAPLASSSGPVWIRIWCTVTSKEPNALASRSHTAARYFLDRMPSSGLLKTTNSLPDGSGP